ncbi:uncharacterized protein LOC122507692 [Leptopilina heterotoma]|uniref:uncharacterized protein LOC122507692 n=1 Tax=Leptopilina heterotoma TaxID=63436 RepID=UPI001CA93003|nr:uncharacterized protein LOC122507692 [Leptopilina heterotoma]
MYKTVRKGDASLQYTILPQTDQFTTSGMPQQQQPQSTRKSKLKVAKYTIVFILFILSCIVTPFLINQNERNIFLNSMLSVGRSTSQNQNHNTVRNSTNNKELSPSSYDEANTNREMSLIVSKIFSKLDASRERNSIEETSTQSESSRSIIDRQDSDLSISEINLVTNRPPPIPSTTYATNFRKSLYSTMPLTSSSIVSASSIASVSSPAPISSLSSSTFASSSLELKSSMVTGMPLKPKMPRVTLKLRENETIPQMYMKAGIASYKKGNITTSVLARGLSLEGLIFKTPEGTIKPWPQKWPFEWMPSDPRWQGTGFTLPMLNTIFSILGVLVGLLCLSSLVLLFLLRLSRRKRPVNIEEPEIEGPEDKSTLLGTENQERTSDRE